MFLGVKSGAILTLCQRSYVGGVRPGGFGVTRRLTNAKRSCIYDPLGARPPPFPSVRLRFFMRTAVVFLVLLLSACAEGTYSSPVDGRLMSRIDKSFAARDA